MESLRHRGMQEIELLAPGFSRAKRGTLEHAGPRPAATSYKLAGLGKCSVSQSPSLFLLLFPTSCTADLSLIK